MYKGNSIGVVVPAYNEEPFVREVIETLPDYVDRVYPVDDASTDDTWREIRRAADHVNGGSSDAPEPPDGPQSPTRGGSSGVRSDAAATADGGSAGARAAPDGTDDSDGTVATDGHGTAAGARGTRVVPLRHEENRGVGGAIKTGYLRARADGVEVTAVMGGDGQMDPDELVRVIDPVAEGRAGYAKGNRFDGSGSADPMPRFRYVGNAILSWLTKVASGYWAVGDPQNGYTAISLSALERVEIEEMYEFYGYCNDLLVRLNVAGVRVVDVPSTAIYEDEESHIDYRTYVPRVSSMLLSSFLRRLSATYLRGGGASVALLYVAGALATAVGVVGASASVAATLDPRSDGDSSRRLASLLLVGPSLLVGAMVGDRQTNRDLCVDVDDSE